MSVTTLQNPATYSIVRTLRDYELHHSENNTDESDGVAPPNEREAPPQSAANDLGTGWESGYRRVPPPRPVDRNLDFESRNMYNNGIERTFVSVMFGGIGWVQMINNAWRATGGKINDTYFRFPIGGEH